MGVSRLMFTRYAVAESGVVAEEKEATAAQFWAGIIRLLHRARKFR